MGQIETGIIVGLLWQPQRSASYANDSQAGRIFATQVIAAAFGGNHAMLGGIVQAIIADGQYGGYEAGFFAAISAAL